MKTVIRLATVLVMVAGLMTVEARMGGMQPNTGSDNLSHIYGKDLAFTATAHTTTTTSGAGQHEMEMGYAMLDGNVRVEMDLAKGIPPEKAANLKKMGIDCTITIHRPAENITYLIYPGLKGYCGILPTGGSGTPAKQPKIKTVELGKETVEGHPCVKTKNIMTFEDGREMEAFVWQATDMKKFPIKTEMTCEQGVHAITVFRNIKMGKPDAALFNPPAGYTKYDSAQEMMMNSIGNLMRGANAPQAGSADAPTPQPQPQPRKFPGVPKNLRNLIPGNAE